MIIRLKNGDISIRNVSVYREPTKEYLYVFTETPKDSPGYVTLMAYTYREGHVNVQGLYLRKKCTRLSFKQLPTDEKLNLVNYLVAYRRMTSEQKKEIDYGN